MTETAILAAGCFWGVEEKFIKTPGVIQTEVGYIGGTKENPTYEEVCQGNTNHAEAIRLFYNEKIIDFEKILNVFFTIHDPTTLNSQGPDFGTQYRSSIFYLDEMQKIISEKIIQQLNTSTYNNKIVTTIEQASVFWIAEEYHQKYIRKKQYRGFLS
tara:strand:- start:52 stop:522 length:471 start_codon:yes stop_codon:yes gene_type:complete